MLWKKPCPLFLLSQNFLNLTGLNLHVVVIQRKVLTAESYVAILKRYKKATGDLKLIYNTILNAHANYRIECSPGWT